MAVNQRRGYRFSVVSPPHPLLKNSPDIALRQAGKTDQQAAGNNVPKCGERPDQSSAPTMNPWANSNKDDADKRLMQAPDTLGAKHARPIHP